MANHAAGHIRLFDGLDFELCGSAESCKPWAFSFFELAQNTGLEVDNCNYPFILYFSTIVRCGQYRHVGFSDVLTMHVLHLVVERYKHPAITSAELDDL